MAAKQVSAYFNKGITPQAFIDGMTQNKEALRRWYDLFAWQDDGDREFFASFRFRDDVRCLILASDWCGDVVRNVPVVLRVLEETGIPVEMMVMEQHTELMDQFLTMGGRSIPVVIIADTGGAVLGQWGPRPAYVQEPMIAFKRDNPDREAPDYQDKLAATRQEIMRRYGEGAAYQQLIVRELRELLAGV